MVSAMKNSGIQIEKSTWPHRAKSPAAARDSSDNHAELHWRTNSSFSPPLLRMWDCRLQADGLPHGTDGVHGSSLSSHSRESRSWVRSERYKNHHHSVSDGILSYSDSPPNNLREPRWTSPVPKFNLGELASSGAGGSRSQVSWLPFSAERRFTTRESAASPSFGSPSSFSESSHWESTSRRPVAFTNRNSRRSYTSKAVYPLVFHNPVSDCETFGDPDISSTGRLSLVEDRTSPYWPDISSHMDYEFHRSLAELQKVETSPDPGASSRREGFRWSSASSYDLGLDGDRFEIAANLDVGKRMSPCCSSDQKCGVCGKLLWQKSPWSSNRIMRGRDMPTAGVLPCSHVFHAECLEQVTPKTQMHDPPCPLCLKNSGVINDASSFSEPLQLALRSIRRNRGVMISEAQGSGSNEPSNYFKERTRRKWPWVMPRQNDSSSSTKDRMKRRFKFSGKISKDIFSSKLFHRTGSSSNQESSQRGMSIQ